MRRFPQRMSVLAGALGLTLAAACAPPPEPPPAGAPRLVVLLVVDQMRADYLTRFGSRLEGGLRTLLDRGVVFTDAHHDHGITSTAPGHASIATGCHPARHGVINNYWWDRETGEQGYAVENDSPSRLLCPTLGDWLKERYPDAKAVTASQKDRSAVMMAGRKADAALWYDWMGGFTTSDFYLRQEPDWLVAFNEERRVNEHFGEAWTAEALTPEETVGFEIDETRLGPFDFDFPHAFGGAAVAPGESFYRGLYQTPVLDASIARLALRAVYAEGLGDDDVPDLLALGFSALDAVGHKYGPNSREVMETVLALDRTIGWLLAELDQKVGLDHVVVALTADHGVAPVPELRTARDLPGARIGADQYLCLQRVEDRLDERLGEADWMLPGRFLNREALALHGVANEVAETSVRQIVEACPGVARVYTRGELLSGEHGGDEAHRRFANGFHPQRSPDFMILWEEYLTATTSVLATHGTPYRYDSWVPLIVMAPGVEATEIAATVRTVDLAPTLARMAGVTPTAEIDGRELPELF